MAHQLTDIASWFYKNYILRATTQGLAWIASCWGLKLLCHCVIHSNSKAKHSLFNSVYNFTSKVADLQANFR